MKTFVKLTLLLYAILFLVSIGCKKNNDNSNPTKDPWAELRNLGPGQIKFSGDKFCFYDCMSDQIYCGERAFMDCDVSKYNLDYFSYNFYFITDYPDNTSNASVYSYIHKVFGLTALVNFCGLTANTYSGYVMNNYRMNSCSDLYSKSPMDIIDNNWVGKCPDHCNECKPNCTGRECGPDGCGGTCGTCPSGKKCSISGTCISGSTADPCTSCLSTCQGIPGCCTGCGCMCESECGGCFK